MLHTMYKIWRSKKNLRYELVREAAKKILLLMAGPLRPPSSFNDRWNFGTLEKKVPKKVFFFFNGPATEEL